MLKKLQEKQMKLWHTTFYDSEIKLKQLYTKICHRLPAYSCKLYVVKEIVNQGKIQVKEVLSQRNPLKKVSFKVDSCSIRCAFHHFILVSHLVA